MTDKYEAQDSYTLARLKPPTVSINKNLKIQNQTRTKMRTKMRKKEKTKRKNYLFVLISEHLYLIDRNPHSLPIGIVRQWQAH